MIFASAFKVCFKLVPAFSMKLISPQLQAIPLLSLQLMAIRSQLKAMEPAGMIVLQLQLPLQPHPSRMAPSQATPPSPPTLVMVNRQLQLHRRGKCASLGRKNNHTM